MPGGGAWERGLPCREAVACMRAACMPSSQPGLTPADPLPLPPSRPRPPGSRRHGAAVAQRGLPGRLLPHVALVHRPGLPLAPGQALCVLQDGQPDHPPAGKPLPWQTCPVSAGSWSAGAHSRDCMPGASSLPAGTSASACAARAAPQVRLRGASILFFVLCVVCYTYVNFSSCSSFMLSWLGYLPMQATRGGARGARDQRSVRPARARSAPALPRRSSLLASSAVFLCPSAAGGQHRGDRVCLPGQPQAPTRARHPAGTAPAMRRPGACAHARLPCLAAEPRTEHACGAQRLPLCPASCPHPSLPRRPGSRSLRGPRPTSPASAPSAPPACRPARRRPRPWRARRCSAWRL